ncbi:MAG TPA: hypothetical protein PLO61_03745 [Fimbriimonadaceae bacterium]|nr:hypothetical protein [Fimbriimonadaceae bacterium]HRJ32744.1 hypothetical protein [Fimbriimonadaceae bacterium]
MSVLRVAQPRDLELLERLRKHPFVELMDEAAPEQGLLFDQGVWRREIRVDDPTAEVFGLTEMMDNNPMVCADSVSVPSAAGTLALIGLAPLIRAGLVVEPPNVLLSFDADPESVDRALSTEGWNNGATTMADPQDLGHVLAATTMAKIQNPDSWDDLDDLFDEAYARSFFVRRQEDSEWDVRLVAGHPHAAYRLRLSEGSPHSILTVQVMADSHGKAGAGQIVHAMNVMAGFEESIGV